MNIPSSGDITMSLAEIFEAARKQERKALWRAIFPVDPDQQIAVPPGKRVVNLVPAWE